MKKKLTVIIPAFNEERAIAKVIANLKTRCREIVHEIIVVDDGSRDATAQLAEKAGARVIQHRQNKGYGASLKTGIRAAETEFVLTMDSDGQHKAEDVVRVWNARNDNDMVVGNREDIFHSPLWRMPGKWLLWLMANYLTRRKIPDLNSGLRLFRRNVILQYMHICPSGFSFSTTSTMALLSQGHAVEYVPIKVERRTGKSTVTLSTGMDTLVLILRIASLFDPLRIFIPGSLLVGATGILWGIPYALAGNGVSVGAMLAIVTSILLFSLGLLCDQISQLRLERFKSAEPNAPRPVNGNGYITEKQQVEISEN